MTPTTNARHRHRAEPTGDVAGNERLTAMTGAVLLVLFAAEGLAILRMQRLACGLVIAAATLPLSARWGGAG